MKKLVLGVVALGVIVNVAFPIEFCSYQRMMYVNCLKYHSGEVKIRECRNNGDCCRDKDGTYTLEQLRMRLEACQIEYGRYSN